MRLKRRRLPNFEACSVALFTSLVLGGAAFPARSQTPYIPSTISTVSASTSPAPMTLRSGATYTQFDPARGGAAIPPNRWTPEQLAQEFKRGDADGDGRLSRQEASVWAGLSRQFDQVDSNKDGSISSAEFDEALK